MLAMSHMKVPKMCVTLLYYSQS